MPETSDDFATVRQFIIDAGSVGGVPEFAVTAAAIDRIEARLAETERENEELAHSYAVRPERCPECRSADPSVLLEPCLALSTSNNTTEAPWHREEIGETDA